MPRIALALAAGMVAAALSPATGAAAPGFVPEGLHCPGQLAFSPGFRSDRTGFCMYSNPLIPLRLYLTEDGGASWQAVAAKGLPSSASDFHAQLFLSPVFASDRGVYIQTEDGLYVSTDRGRTFALVEQRAGATGLWMRDIEPYVETAQGLEAYEKVVFAYAGGGDNALADDAAKLDPPARIPVLGSPGSDIRFLVPRDFDETGTAFTLAHGGAGLACEGAVYCAGTALFECTFALVCLEQIEAFPTQFAMSAEIGTRRGVPFVYVLTRDYLSQEVGAWRLRGDRGAELENVPRLMPRRPQPPYSQETWARLGLHPGRPEVVYLRWLNCQHPPEELDSVYPDLMQEGIFRSTDAGETWRRVGFRREWVVGTPVTGFTRHSTGTLPWNMRDWCAPPEIEVAPDGRLFVTAVFSRTDAGTTPGPTYYGPYCSVDGGREWERRCPSKRSR